MRELLPVRFRILHEMGKGKEEDITTLMNKLKEEYGNEKHFNEKEFIDHLLTLEANGLVEETRFELKGTDDINSYYKISDAGKDLLKNYLPKAWRK